jgi:hypothetical protein
VPRWLAPAKGPGTPPVLTQARRFIDGAAIEGEIRDAQTGELLAAGVDRRRREGAPPIDTWAALQRALDAWMERCRRCTRRPGAGGCHR